MITEAISIISPLENIGMNPVIFSTATTTNIEKKSHEWKPFSDKLSNSRDYMHLVFETFVSILSCLFKTFFSSNNPETTLILFLGLRQV